MLLLVLAGTLIFPFGRGLVYGHGKDAVDAPATGAGDDL